MKIYTGETVLEAARKRMAFVFDEFDQIYVAFSGGKDSTVTLHLALEEARRRDRLPVKVLFVDQEAEWKSTIDYVRDVMHRDDVDPYWLQVPIKISNSASVDEDAEWLQCWQEGAQWMRPQEPDSIKINRFGTDRFKEMFDHVLATYHPDQKACIVGGVRAEESPGRRFALTKAPKYKWVTWCKRLKAKGGHPHFSFYPIWDWTYKDVWKYIHDSGAAYCKVYDYMYQHGVPAFNMRVSNLHHETAVKSLYYMQEVEQDTWEALSNRLGGVHVARNLGHANQFSAPKKLPWMFKSWIEYRDHLLDKLIGNPEHQAIYRREFARLDRIFERMVKRDRLTKVQIVTLLANDFHLTKCHNFISTPEAGEFMKWRQGHPIKERFGAWVPPEELAKAPKHKSGA